MKSSTAARKKPTTRPKIVRTQEIKYVYEDGNIQATKDANDRDWEITDLFEATDVADVVSGVLRVFDLNYAARVGELVDFMKDSGEFL